MTMPPSGIKSEMDEEAVIEAEIQQELDLIDLENEDVNNNLEDLTFEDLNDQRKLGSEEDELNAVEGYLSRLQQQTEHFEKELAECDDLVNYHQPGKTGVATDIDGLAEEAQRSGVDPEELRKRILTAIDNESDDEITENVEKIENSDIPDTSTFVTEGSELLAERSDKSVDESGENITLQPDEGVIALVDEIQTQEQFFKQQLHVLDMKYREREQKWKIEAENKRKEMEEKENIENEKRKQIMIQHEKEKEEMEIKLKIAEEKLNEEVEEQQKKIQSEVKRFEEQITLLESETRREQEELEKSVHERLERQKQREITSATTLQASFRSYRVRKVHGPLLKQKREERAKDREKKRIEEVEKDIKERKEAEKKKQEEEQRVEKEKEEERKKEQEKLEEKKRNEERRKREEEQRIEEEKKKKEEEARIIEEKKKEEEALKLEEEKRKRAEEKEKERILKEKEMQEKLRLEQAKKEKEEKERIEREKAKKEKERKEKEEREMKEKETKEREKCERETEERRLREEENELEEKRKMKEQQLREENERLKEELLKLKGQKSDNENENTHIKQVNPEKDIEKTESVIDMTPDEKMSLDDAKKTTSDKHQTPDKSYKDGTVDKTKDMLGRSLPQHLESRRLAWIKECVPWSKISNEPWKLKGGISKKPPRRPSSAKKLSPLAEDIIITAARVATLKQVTTVQLHDLPGCNLSTFSQCWGLKSLTMTNCNLVALDGLQQCKQLQYVNMKSNKLEYIDLKDLGNLHVVDLSNNNLSVLHGLDGCTNIRWLDVSCNRLTRLNGLDPLRRLHTLIASSNQLICNSGVSDVPTLQHLDLSNNHLQGVDSINKLCLLQRLNVSSNNLLQFPDVRNQVLLEECDLSDNSISSLEGVTNYWLPLLSRLNLSKNSLTDLEVLDNLLLLKNLDVSNNQVLDLESMCTALSHLSHLEDLWVSENPATEETGYSDKLTKLLPRLQTLDSTNLAPSTHLVLQPATDFEAMCRTQLQFLAALRNTFLQELQSAESTSPVDDLSLCEVYFRYCDKSFKLTVEHRYAHEYGEISMNMPVAPSTPRSGRPRSARAKIPHIEPESYLTPKEMFEKALKSDGKKESDVKSAIKNSSENPKDLFEKALKEGRAEQHSQGEEYPKSEFVDASRLQSNGGELLQSGQENNNDENSNSPSKAWTESPQNDVNLRASLQNLTPAEMAILEDLHTAATKIQSAWRGFCLRLKLSAALEYARLEYEDDISELDDFNMDDLAFDEESLEKGWRPAETPQIPHNHPLIGKPPSGRRTGQDGMRLELGPVHPPNRPRQAWRNTDSPLSDMTPHPPHPPLSVRSGTDTHRTGLSKKEEKLAEEWGFHNSRTAELMLQRAKKMKLNSDRKRKLSRLDPKQRLALYRKLEEATKLSPIRPPIRKTLPRKEYFQDISTQPREDEVRKKEFEKRQEAQTRSTRTYEWLHTQVATSDTNNRYVDRHSHSGSDVNLATVHNELTGSGRLQMMNYAGFDEDSHKGDRKPRRFSSSESTGQSSFLPPINTGSAGSGGSEGRQRRKEKMSWRNKPTEVDVGWGGGRKRSQNK